MKKKLSRIAAMLLAVVMVITGIAVMPSSDVKAADRPSFTVKVSSTEVKPGDTVTVEFWLDAGVDVTSFAGFLNIDQNVYELVRRQYGDLYDELDLKGALPIFSADESGDGFLVLFGDEVPMSNGGLIATLTLRVKENASGSGNISFSYEGGTVGPDADHEVVDDPVGDESKTVDPEGNVIEGGNIPVVIELEGLTIDQDDFTMAR